MEVRPPDFRKVSFCTARKFSCVHFEVRLEMVISCIAFGCQNRQIDKKKLCLNGDESQADRYNSKTEMSHDGASPSSISFHRLVTTLLWLFVNFLFPC